MDVNGLHVSSPYAVVVEDRQKLAIITSKVIIFVPIGKATHTPSRHGST